MNGDSFELLHSSLIRGFELLHSSLDQPRRTPSDPIFSHVLFAAQRLILQYRRIKFTDHSLRGFSLRIISEGGMTMATSETSIPVARPAEEAVSSPERAAITGVTPPPAVTHKRRRVLIIVAAVVAVAACAIWIVSSLGNVSTDDAYVNGHVTFVAPRVAGQVTRVLVDDNYRVRKGDLLVQLDREPYQVAVNIAQAAVASAQADLVVATSEARGIEGKMRSLRFALDNAIEDVDNQVALLRSKVATLDSQKALRDKAQADFDRVVPLLNTGSITQEDYDHRKQLALVAQANYEEALQGVYSARVALGLPPTPAVGNDLTEVPADLDQTFSAVRQAQASLIEEAAQIGLNESFQKSPKQMVTDFYKRDPGGDIDKIYAELLKKAPSVKQAEAKLVKAQADLASAELNLRYCDVVAEIDGVVTRRNVNPGNNVIAGQSLMAIRSLTEIWVDANFKETQLADLRIGQPVDLDVDMYGRRQHFDGRISGFTNGTGSTLALLPAQNATGNFVKVVQRLPVRIDLVNYDPDKTPLFIGLSVTPTVHTREPATGPDAGKVLQPDLAHISSASEPATVPASAPGTQS
jgi:membrane fusion protein (multidrug efflux system)